MTSEKKHVGGALKHRKLIRDSIQGITKPAIRRLCRRAEVLRINGMVYEEIRGIMKVYMEEILRNAVTFTEHDRRKTVQEEDLDAALEVMGLYLGAGINPNTSKTFTTVKARQSAKTTTEAGETKKMHRYKPGTVAKRDIIYQQKQSDDLAIPKL